MLSNYFSPFSLHEAARTCIFVHQNRPSLPPAFWHLKKNSPNPCYKCTAADKNNMIQQPQTIPSALADHIVSAALSLDAAFSQPPVFTVENRNRFHNSSLLPYNSVITPPLLANPRTAFSVKITGQWPIPGCRSRALIVVSGTQGAGNKIKNQSNMMHAQKIPSVRPELASSATTTMGVPSLPRFQPSFLRAKPVMVFVIFTDSGLFALD